MAGLRHSLSDFGSDGTATCTICGTVPVSKKGLSPGGLQRYACGNTRRATFRGTHPGLTVSEVKSTKDGASCAICGNREQLVIDHDHATGALRGILCGTCNAGMGFLGDTEESLMRVVMYLRNPPGVNLGRAENSS